MPYLLCANYRTIRDLTLASYDKQIDEVNDLFTEARELIEDAQDEAETVYFNEAHQEAKDAVNDVLARRALWLAVALCAFTQFFCLITSPRYLLP